MRVVSDQHTAAWKSGDFTGLRRPMQRVTIQPMLVGINSYEAEVYASYLFAQAVVPLELPNVKSIKWDRHTDTDAATCTVELYNTEPLPLGTAVVRDDAGNYRFDQPGYYTFNRGRTPTSRWHHAPNKWQDLIAPDRILRTYEGYGYNAAVGPEFDANMVQSGVWIIDKVSYTATGLITVECRDGGRLLIDQMLFPPVVPKRHYPLSFTSYHDVDNVAHEDPATVWTRPTYDTDSSGAHSGPDQNIAGHHAHDAFDADPLTYWLSVGYNVSDAPYAYEWIQGEFASQDVKAVDVTVRGGPYVVYVSLYTTYNGTGAPVARRWAGGAVIPYDPDSSSSPNGANIRYVHQFTVPANSRMALPMGDTITDTTKVRLTFRHLYNSHLGTPTYSTETYRAAVYSARVSANYALTSGVGTHVEGDYGDYSDLVRWLLAIGGFHWPRDAAQAFLTRTNGSKAAVMPPSDEPFLGQYGRPLGGAPIVGAGRVWADVMDTGVAAVAGSTLGPPVWDKKSVMDGIAYIRDVVGFIFLVDETGAGVFRSPNVWKIGNYVGDAAAGPAYVEGIDTLVVIDENETLEDLGVTLDSHNIRDRVFISNTDGQIGATAPGHTGIAGPYNSRLRRVGGWSDQNFATNAECNIMADLISLRQLFSYRTDRLTIPGYSRIQVDDQVRILEGTTSEDYVHYVRGLSSNWDIETGVWSYTLDTHWLGEDPLTHWVFSLSDFSADTQAFLAANGSV